jgi:uncharacterized protein (TIGR02246 family)
MDMSEQEIAAANAGIDQTLAEWASALADGDIVRISGLVTEDAEFWTQGAAPLTGRGAVAAAVAPILAAYKFSQRFDVHERCLGLDWVLLRGTEINTVEPRNGGPSAEIRQRAFSVLRRERDGRWRFARGMTNQGPAETPANRP